MKPLPEMTAAELVAEWERLTKVISRLKEWHDGELRFTDQPFPPPICSSAADYEEKMSAALAEMGLVDTELQERCERMKIVDGVLVVEFDNIDFKEPTNGISIELEIPKPADFAALIGWLLRKEQV